MKNLNLMLVLLSVIFVSSGLYFSPYAISQAPRIHIKDGTSTNWAGYAINQTYLASTINGAVTDVKGSWVVPAVDCSVTPSAYSAFWLGIDGYSDTTVEQIGTDSDCSSGSAKYYAWYEMYPKLSTNLRMAISPGDLITAEVKYIGNSKFQLTIIDGTQTFTTTQKLSKAQRSSAEWIAEAPSSGGVLPLANFGTVQFSGAQATLNGHSGVINDASWQYDPINMTTSSGTLKAQTSGLSSGGNAFSVTWMHS